MANRPASERGGVQQRRKRQREDENEESGVAKYLVEEAVWGHLSAPAVQRIASLANLDVCRAVDSRNPAYTYDSLRLLSGMGGSGEYPNHMWTELKGMLSNSKFLCRTVISMPMKILGTRGRFRQVQQSINDPHVMLADIYEHYPEASLLFVASHL